MDELIAQAKAAFRVDPEYLINVIWDARSVAEGGTYQAPLRRGQDQCRCGEPKAQTSKQCLACRYL